MQITLISPYPDITNFGLRTISAYLKASGHTTRLIFLPDPYGDDVVPDVLRYDDRTLDGIIPLCADSDLVGISVMTNYFEGAIQITQKIKSRLNKRIIWGGIHPTVCPEECLEHADMVCIGEGEESIRNLVERMSDEREYAAIKGIWLKKDGSIVRNPIEELRQDLDGLPYPDYDTDHHYIMFEDRIEKMTVQHLEMLLRRGTVSHYLNMTGYQTLAGRGCPHRCSYCCNHTLRNFYPGQRYVRWRSVKHFVGELGWVREHLPFVDYVWISDDTFLGQSSKKIQEFCEQYKDKIGLPFFCLASPLTISEEKLDLLADAGLFFVQMGIESGSRKTQKRFDRARMSNERILAAAAMLNKYKAKMIPPQYDFIVDVPGETVEDKLESIRLIAKLPRPYRLQIFSLVLFPGTTLYRIAKDNGFILDDRNEIYNRSWNDRKINYINLLFLLAKSGRMPGWFLRRLADRYLVKVFNTKLANKLLVRLMPAFKKGLSVVKQHFCM
ncbi:MAG: anaerobic magnesium-protoporphyrin monomethyl ester cyclase [Thermodesulfobacteriota bacterium]|nr:anaerobic magnesium-protoporphyrin monomethyl ester cyclase [Thermodesulfobacteriota bacterium]